MSTGSEALFGIFPGLDPPVVPKTVREIRTERPYAVTNTREGGRRRHPPANVGDTFGLWRVVALLPRDATRNERVRVTCPAGHERDSYVFNLRSSSPAGRRCRCPRCPR